MNIIKSMKLVQKYSKCQECGSELIGNGEGTLQIESKVFRRTCKCGWKIEVKEE